MSGLFGKLTGKKKSAKDLSVEEALALAKDSIDESWIEHEVSDEIHEDVDTLELESPTFDVPVPGVANEDSVELAAPLSEAEFESLGEGIEQTATRLAKLDVADLDRADLGSESDPLDDITQKIKADIAGDKRLKVSETKKDAVLEITSEFGLPDFEVSPELRVPEQGKQAKK